MPSTGTSITNILSQGADQTSQPADIYMVSTYEWHHPEVKAESDEHKKLIEHYRRIGAETVAHTVAVAKQMKIDGSLAKLLEELVHK